MQYEYYIQHTLSNIQEKSIPGVSITRLKLDGWYKDLPGFLDRYFNEPEIIEITATYSEDKIQSTNITNGIKIKITSKKTKNEIKEYLDKLLKTYNDFDKGALDLAIT